MSGYTRNKAITVGKLRALLAEFDDDRLVVSGWEDSIWRFQGVFLSDDLDEQGRPIVVLDSDPWTGSSYDEHGREIKFELITTRKP